MDNVFENVTTYLSQISLFEGLGLIFGLLCVFFLIKESVWTWPTGIAYVLVSLIVFWNGRLYGDLMLHVFFLILNIYGWYHWIYGSKKENEKVKIEKLIFIDQIKVVVCSIVGIFLLGYGLSNIHVLFDNLDPASLPYWDASTSALSVTGMWLTARKKIDNWYYWLVVDILATGIYTYKEIYFYAVLYLIYIVLALIGYREWKKLMLVQD